MARAILRGLCPMRHELIVENDRERPFSLAVSLNFSVVIFLLFSHALNGRERSVCLLFLTIDFVFILIIVSNHTVKSNR